MRVSAPKLRLALLSGPSLLILAAACGSDFDTTRATPPRGTIGEELFGVVCDRVSAEALREDLSGASYQGVCHKDASGNYADAIDVSKLPPATDGLVSVDGGPVTVDEQNANRTYAINRIGALVRDRAALIEAFDTTFPNVLIPSKDITNSDPTKTCDPATGDAALQKMGSLLSDMLGRFTPLYDDGTIPSSTESIARLANAFQASPDAQTALQHFSARNGYRPLAIALGLTRPIVAYSQFRDFSAKSLKLFSSDSDPYNPNPKYDQNGHRLQTPGSAYAQLSALMSATHEELRTSTADPALAALTVTPDPIIGHDVLSRPRSNLEVMRQLFYATDPTFNTGATTSSYIVQRDSRGVATIPLVNGAVPPPFVDKDGDLLPDLDPTGNFITTNGTPAPAPFLSLDAPDSTPRDSFGRALVGGGLIYGYLDTSHLFSAQLITDTKPLVDPVITDNHETLMNALGGAWVLYGARTGSLGAKKTYSPDPNAVNDWNLAHPDGTPAPPGLATDPVVVEYNGFNTDTSSMLDLVYAIGNILGDKSTDDTLAYTRALMTGNTSQLARVAGGALAWKAVADKHPEAKNAHNPTSTFWDEMLTNVEAIAKVPGLLEDVLRALGDPTVLGGANNVPLGTLYSNYMAYGDHISYDRNNLNGPAFNFTTNTNDLMKTPVDRTKPDTGFQRSAFARFLQAIYDTDGVTACNKDGAVAHAQDLPIFGSGDIYSDSPYIGSLGASTPFKECEVYKIENLAKFYLDSTIGRAQLTFRPDIFREGLNLGITHVGAATVATIEDSTAIGNGTNCGAGPCIPGSPDTNTGDKLWVDATHYGYFPTPQFLNRLVYFDLAGDSPNSGDKNYTTNHFLADMQGPYIGTAVCPERVIADPCVGNSHCPSSTDPGYDVSADGMVHGLRTCADGDNLQQRDPDATMVWEDFGFYSAMAPVVTAFANHNSEELLIQVLDTLYRHWQDAQGTPQDCDPTNPSSLRYCTQDGLETYEPLLSEAFLGDMLPALNSITQTLQTVTVPHCTAFDPKTNLCTASTPQDGITTLAATTRALFDEDQAQAINLRDRLGNTYGLKNDGTHTAQVTPIYLLTNALDHIDAQFAAYAKANPTDAARQTQWLSARSQLVDQFLKVAGATSSSVFANQALPKFSPTLIDVIRAQLFANCPTSFAPPYPRCEWARTILTQKMATTMSGPTFAGLVDVVDAIRADNDARQSTEALLSYLLDAAAQNDAQASVLASTDDLLQLLQDDTNLVPLYHVLSEAAGASIKDQAGNVVQSSMVDSNLALLSLIAAYATDANGVENCGLEVDPDQVLNIALKNIVTPLPPLADGLTRKTPLEVIMDVIDDVNRVAPDQTTKLAPPDYANISANVSDFLINKQSGLEQFYAVVRTGTE
jgi:hypothetical protein